MSEPNLASSALAAEDSYSVLQEEPALHVQSDNGQTLEAVALNVITDGAIDDATQHSAIQHSAIRSTEPLQHYLATWIADHHGSHAIDPGFVEALLQQATLALESQRQQWAHEQAAQEAELRRARSLSNHRIERIRHLEQALDQSLASLSEMRLQAVDQQLLEAQLASTEDISNIQQQAIVRLRLQLAQQQQALSAQLTETQARDRALQTLLHTMEALTQTQQHALDQLRTQMADDRTDVQASQHCLETQLRQLQTDLHTQQEQTVASEHPSLDAPTLAAHLAGRLEQAQAQVSAFTHSLSDRQLAFTALETELQQAQLALQDQQVWLDRMQQSCQAQDLTTATATPVIVPREIAPEAFTGAIAPDLVTAYARIVALEAQAAKQTTTQAMLRHACQELEEERARQQTRLTELEKQTTEMQEQILRQAQQASEYETAIQHWKDRCFTSQNGLLQLQALLDQALPNRPAALSELLATLLAAADEPEPGSPTLHPMTSLQPAKVDLPDFLLRRRDYKRGRS